MIAVMLLALPLTANAVDNPQDMVKNATDTLLAHILKDKEVLKKDPQALYQLVEQNITPFVDVDGIARGVMGQYFRQATPAQRTEFIAVFKQSLVRTYAKGLTSYDNQKITFKPYKQGSDAKKAQVNLEVQGSSGQIYPVTFELRLNNTGAWKVNNIILNGINLGLTFRNQFGSMVETNNGNIDKAIASWAPDTKALEGKTAK
jgi:phospholipid transport system substrate-binding protein